MSDYGPPGGDPRLPERYDPFGPPAYPTYGGTPGGPGEAPPGYPSAPPQSPPPRGPGGWRPVLVAVGVLVVAAAFVVAVLAARDDDNTTQVSAGTDTGQPGPTAFPSQPSNAGPSPLITGYPGTGLPSVALPSINASGAAGATLEGIKFFTALSAHELATAKALGCSGSNLTVTQAQVDDVGAALPTGAAIVSGSSSSSATMGGNVIHTDGHPSTASLSLRRTGTAWCVSAASGI